MEGSPSLSIGPRVVRFCRGLPLPSSRPRPLFPTRISMVLDHIACLDDFNLSLEKTIAALL